MRPRVRGDWTGLPIDPSLPSVPQSVPGIAIVQQAQTATFLHVWADIMEQAGRRAEAAISRELIQTLGNSRRRPPNGELVGRFAHELLDRGQPDDALTISSILNRMAEGNYAKQHHIDPYVARLSKELLGQ
jgi:hypothetical protein